MLICYLSWAKLGLDYVNLAFLLGNISSSRVEENILRIRPKLKTTMFQWWFDQLPQRPLLLADTPFPHIALLVDATTTPCFHPRGCFEDAKVYYNTKNKIYGLKTEVAVTAQPPYFALISLLWFQELSMILNFLREAFSGLELPYKATSRACSVVR